MAASVVDSLLWPSTGRRDEAKKKKEKRRKEQKERREKITNSHVRMTKEKKSSRG